MNASQLWTSQAMIEAMRASRRGALPDGVTGLSIDSRTIAFGEGQRVRDKGNADWGEQLI